MASKPDWFYSQSAVVPYRRSGDELRVVVITSASGTGWVIPKGIVEKGMTPQDSAAKEALEEAGVKGHVSSRMIAEYEYEKWGGTCKVKVFPMEVTELLQSWPEEDVRHRRLVGIDEAIELVKPRHRHGLVRFKELLGEITGRR